MKVFVGVTTLTGYIDAGCTSALVANLQALGVIAETRLEFIAGSCYIQDARNKLAHAFMESDFDRMIFVDSDLWFSEDAMVRLCKSGKPVCAGAYPRKRGGGWPLTICVNEETKVAITNEQGLIKAKMLPTGLMSITRDVFSALRAKHPDWIDKDGMCAYFQVQNSGRFQGEDPFFCEKCRDEGIEIWLEPRINFMHYGINFVSGNYHDYLLSMNPNPTPAVAEVKEEVLV